MKLTPVLTEKSLALTNNGKYTFWVDSLLTKHQIRALVEKTFGVTVKKVRVVKKGSELKKSLSRRKRFLPAQKKAIVTLAEKQKIDLFEEVSEK